MKRISAKKSGKNAHLIIIFIVGIALLLLVLKTTSQFRSSTISPSLSDTSEVKILLESIKKNSQIPEIQNAYISEIGVNDTQPSIWVERQTPRQLAYFGEYEFSDLLKRDDTSNETLQKIASEINTLLIKNQFSPNNTNSFNHQVESTKAQVTQAYERGEIKCRFSYDTLFFQFDPRFSLVCGKLWDDMPVTNAHGGADPNITFEVQKIIGIYARGVVYEFDGTSWIAVKENGVWKIIAYDGQAVPECSDLDKYQVPRELYRACLDGTTQRQGYWKPQ